MTPAEELDDLQDGVAHRIHAKVCNPLMRAKPREVSCNDIAIEIVALIRHCIAREIEAEAHMAGGYTPNGIGYQNGLREAARIALGGAS